MRINDALEAPFLADIHPVTLAGAVDYVASVLGAATAGGTLPDPRVAVFDQAGTLIDSQDNSFALGPDPMLIFRAPYTGTYYIGVDDPSGGFGTYSLIVDHAGIPTTFGGPLGDIGI